MNSRRWKKWSFCILVFGLLVGLSGLYLISDGHTKEYLIWRWMVTFNQPVHPVADYHIVVSKSAHQLTVFHSDKVTKTFPIAISKHRVGTRKVWEDELTP